MSRATTRRKRHIKKDLPERLHALRAQYPDDTIELWAMDEHRVGLKPIVRRVWSRRGQRPQAPVRPRYQWLYVYGFVEPCSGATAWWLMPTVSIPAFNAALQHFAQVTGAGQGKQVVLVLDRAGWHMSARVEFPRGLHLAPLPAYSPQLQPAERLWPLTNEALANRCFDTLEALEQAQAARCLALQDRPGLVRAHTQYHWWPTAQTATV